MRPLDWILLVIAVIFTASAVATLYYALGLQASLQMLSRTLVREMRKNEQLEEQTDKLLGDLRNRKDK